MTLSGGGPEMQGPLHPFPQMSGITTPQHPTKSPLREEVMYFTPKSRKYCRFSSRPAVVYTLVS